MENKNRVDVMVDIETLGKGEDATVFQISAIAFDITTGRQHKGVFDMIADIEQNEELHVDGSTLKWWLNTDKELLAILLNKGTCSSEELLKAFHVWMSYWVQVHLEEKNNTYLWGNGILFDNRIIKHQMEKIGLEYPVFYRNDRDVRTILELASLKTGMSEQEIKDSVRDETLVAHNAIDDVKKQINLVVECYKLIVGD